MFHAELWSLHKTPNWTLYLIYCIDCSNSVNHDQVQVLGYSKYFFVILTCSWDWTCNLQMIPLSIIFEPNILSLYNSILLVNSEGIFLTYKPNVSINQWDTTYYYVWFFFLP